MELLLNVVWMLTTLGFLIAWRFCWIPQKGKSLRNSLQELAAIVCTLVILFFAISLSDDLRADAILSDDCVIGRRHSISATSRPGGNEPQHKIARFGSALPVANQANFAPQPVSTLLVVEPCQRNAPIRGNSLLTRGPPFSS
jgi:hypothetical protein